MRNLPNALTIARILVALVASVEELALLATLPRPDLDVKGWLWRVKAKL